MDSHSSRYVGSERQVARARESLAGGVATARRATQRPTPLVMESAEGCRLTDVDGNVYIDYVLGFGPLLLGHSPRAVIDAVTAQLDRGLTYGAQHRAEAELAELVVATAPCAERVCFSSSGSEAVHAALRIARAHTGRSKVLKFEGHYHGWIDPVHVSTPGKPAAPSGAAAPLDPVAAAGGQGGVQDVVVARWNDPGELEGVLERTGAEVAAVVMEAMHANGGVIEPEPGYLDAVRRLTRQAGALLVFDEVVTGYRIALGGAQERYGVVPDLAAYGKAIAAGFPLSAVAGTQEVMSVVEDGRVPHIGTFNCNPPAAAAAIAAIGAYREGDPELYARLERLGRRLADGLADAAAESGVALRVHQVGSLIQTLALDPSREVRSYADVREADSELMARFAEAMLERGVMVLPRGWWFLSTAHGDDEVEETIGAARGAFAAVAEGARTRS